MKRHLLLITTAASILVCGTLAANAQEDSDEQTVQCPSSEILRQEAA